MTRVLSQLLGAVEPDFGLQLQRLERWSGHPEADIRLSSQINARVQAKIRDLGLDPQDTSGPELYHALTQRLLADEIRLRTTVGLQGQASAIDVLGAVRQFTLKADIPRSCFALKTSVAKRLLQAQAPKKTMKALGYRSLASMLKHEPVAALYVAASLYESPQWHTNFTEQYGQLTPSDFEVRTISIVFPRSKRWDVVANDFSATYRHVSTVLEVLGVVVLLPVAAQTPALALTSLLSLFDQLNTIRCASAFLKLQQVRPDFGQSVIQAAAGEPRVSTEVSGEGQAMPWRALQYYYHKVRGAYHPAIFEPHVQPEDLALAEAEHCLVQAVPALEFWLDTADLALLHDGQTVSFNMLDVALGAANHLSFDQRMVQHVRQHISTELMSCYLRRHQEHQQLLQQQAPIITPSLEAEGLPV